MQAPSPEIWSETISGGEEVLAGKWGGLFLGYLLGRNYRRRDRDHIIPPRRMDAALCRADVCYPFGRKHGRHRAVRRRSFMTLLGGAAVAWPLAARAQQGEHMRRIGILAQGAANDPETAARLTAFVQGLQELGWSIGRNARIEYRWADGDMTLIRKHAAELLAFEPDVIMAAGGLGVRPLLDLTSTVPIVFDALDPVTGGFVDSLARPGGNATGFSQFELAMSGKWLELLNQIAPNVKRVAVFRDPLNIASVGQFSSIQAVAPPLGVELFPIDV